MLCRFCQNLVFSPAEELNVPNVYRLTPAHYKLMPGNTLISVHQPSQKALNLSAGRGCRVCAFFWFRLTQAAGSAHAYRDNDHGVAPVLLSMKWELCWDKDLEAQEGPPNHTLLSCGGKEASLQLKWPISGMSNE